MAKGLIRTHPGSERLRTSFRVEPPATRPIPQDHVPADGEEPNAPDSLEPAANDSQLPVGPRRKVSCTRSPHRPGLPSRQSLGQKRIDPTPMLGEELPGRSPPSGVLFPAIGGVPFPTPDILPDAGEAVRSSTGTDP